MNNPTLTQNTEVLFNALCFIQYESEVENAKNLVPNHWEVCVRLVCKFFCPVCCHYKSTNMHNIENFFITHMNMEVWLCANKCASQLPLLSLSVIPPPCTLLSPFSSSHLPFIFFLILPLFSPPSHLPLCSFSSPPSQNVSVTFVSNTAGHAGAAIYAADISGCTFTNMECKPTINYNTTYQRSIFVQSPFTFKLVKPLRKDNCIGICTH